VQEIYKHIALTLKALRQQRGWSLDIAAKETGVSKAMLGQIERQESSPTIATLWKIAAGFNISFSSLLEDIQPKVNETMYRPSQPPDLHPADYNIKVATLFPFDPQLHCEIFKIDLLPGCKHLSPPHQTGVIEHVIVVDGAIELLLNKKWQLLRKGEGLRFNANQPHGYRNTTKKIACIHDIIHYSTSG
jgi:XRE family transcriptional regulator, regulator of sulfur utilization